MSALTRVALRGPRPYRRSMRFRLRAFALLSLLAVGACVGESSTCLNPQPDLPSCRSESAPGVAGAGVGGAFNTGSAGGPPAVNAGGSSASGSGAVSPDAGSDSLGAAGTTGEAGASGAAGDAGAAGEAGSASTTL